jgi:hypothetical protein
VLALVFVGAGVIAIGVGGVFALSARSKNSESKGPGLCDDANRCTPAGASLRDDAIHRANTAQYLAGGGAALVVGGLAWWFLSGEKPKSSTTVSFAPTGITVQGHF